ncbi:ABC transporter permease [Bacteroidota bacterium]
MIKNYLKIAIRNFLRHKTFSLINILGLSVGIACTIIIFLFVKYELTYDSYHPDSDRIYRVSRILKRQNKDEGFAAINTPCGPTMRDIYPEIESMFRIRKGRMAQFRTDNNRYMEEDFHYVDSSIFEILHLPLLEGNPSTALDRPFTAILSERASEKYFGKENPVGKTIMVDTFLYEVTGIMKNIPGNTHLKFNMLFSWNSFDISFPRPPDWPASPWVIGNVCTYIKLFKGTDPEVFEAKISDLVHRYDGESLDKQGVEVSLFLQEINSIHLNSNLIWEPAPPGNKLFIYIFSGIGLLIILIACLNFMNLSTAKYINRAKEVGIRKTVGASRRKLIRQFYGESLLIAFISHIIAMIITELSLPLFNNLFGLTLKIHYFDLVFISGIVIIIIFVGLLAGTYPALYLSSFKPVKVLNSSINPRSGGITMRRILVVGQFAISIFLIANTIMLFKQLSYMKNQDLGFNKENKLLIRFADDVLTKGNYESIKSEFLNVPGVTGATVTSSVPGKWMYLWRTYPTNKQVENTQYINYFQHDFDFFEEFGLEIIAGRGFNRDRDAAYNNGYVINEAAYKTFGIESAEEALEAKFHDRGEPVVGVVKDFHIKGLQEKIGPLFMFITTEDYKFMCISISDSDPITIKDAVEEKFNELFPEEVPRCSFLDEDFNSQYQKEERLGKLFTVFTVLGIIIACLGLFGMSSYMAEQRRKEIGIRKVNGASVVRIVVLLSADFIKWVFFALIVASPIIYIVLNKWLKNFAYSAKIDIWVYVISGAIALIIALFTTIYQAFKAAKNNPVNSLRYE